MLIFIKPATLKPKGIEFVYKGDEIKVIDTSPYERTTSVFDGEIKVVDPSPYERTTPVFDGKIVCCCFPLNNPSPRYIPRPDGVAIVNNPPELIIIHCKCKREESLVPGTTRVYPSGSRFGSIAYHEKEKWGTTLITHDKYRRFFDLDRFDSVIICEFSGYPMIIKQ